MVRLFWNLSDLKANGMSNKGKAKKARKFAAVKRMLNPNDARLCVIVRFFKQ